jgi:hypothetical protein
MSMGWVATIGLAIGLLAAGLYALLVAAIIVTALVERRPLKPLAPADPDDPEWQKLGSIPSGAGSSPSPEPDPNLYSAPGTTTYAESQIRAASELGFSAPRLYKHALGGIYKTHNVLTVSAKREILAYIRWGTTGSIRNEVTSLYSALDDGQYLITSDRPIGSRTPGFYDDQVYLGASFAQLVGRHKERLQASGKNANCLSVENPLAEYEAILERRARFLVERGDAKWVDAGQTAFRSTLRGALRAYTMTLSARHVDQSLRVAAGEKKMGI